MRRRFHQIRGPVIVITGRLRLIREARMRVGSPPISPACSSRFHSFTRRKPGEAVRQYCRSTIEEPGETGLCAKVQTTAKDEKNRVSLILWSWGMAVRVAR